MEKLKKLFGGIGMPWKRVLIFSVVTAAVSAVLLLLPFDMDIAGMGSTFPWWILFALVIITNCEKPLEAACKTFVFFLISQPLIYILQAPFSPMGLGLLQYYPPWFVWTLLTFPGAWIGWHIRKPGVLSGVILSVMLYMVGIIGWGYLEHGIRVFPKDFMPLVSALFCAAEFLLLFFVLLPESKQRMAALLCTGVLVAGTAVFYSRIPEQTKYSPLPEDIRAEEIAEIRVADPKLFRVSVEDGIGPDTNTYLLIEAMKETCSTEITLIGTDGAELIRYEAEAKRVPDERPDSLPGYCLTMEVREIQGGRE